MTGIETIGTEVSKPTCIAVVDDDERVRHSLTTLLRSLGLQAATYASASDFLASDKEHVDCVLTDLQMPDLSGIDLLIAIKAKGSKLPVVIMTAFPEDMVRRRAVALGAVGFFDKPIDVDELVACLKLVVDRFEDGSSSTQ